MFAKKLILIALLVGMPLAAFANSNVDFSNVGGTLTGSNSGLSLAGSTLIAINGLNLGSLSFSTGSLMSGSTSMGGTFATGGSFTIVGNGSNGVPSGAIFSGTFSTPAVWTMVTLPNGSHNYTLTATVTGTWLNGATVSGATVQLSVNTGKGFFNGRTSLASGDTNIVVVPEPGSLTLLGTGLMGLAGVVRRKFAR